MKNLIAAVLLLGCGTVSAVTIDFEEFAPGTEGNGSITTQGFTLTSAPSAGIGYSLEENVFNNPTVAYAYCSICTATLESTTGDPFSLQLADVAIVHITPHLSSLTITGYLTGGGTVQTVFSQSVGPQAFETVVFPTEWASLERVEFGPADGSVFNGMFLDNINVEVVPIPAAVWLFGSGLGLLGWIRKRKGMLPA